MMRSLLILLLSAVAACAQTIAVKTDASGALVLPVASTFRTANSLADASALNASNLTSGTVPNARFPATLPAASAANLTSIPAANLTGVVPAANGGAGSVSGVLQANGSGTVSAFTTSGSGNLARVTSAPLITPTIGGGTTITRIKFGVAVLSSGTATVSDSTVTANSRIFLTAQSVSGSAGFLTIGGRSAGVNFTISSSNAGDNSTVAWLMIEP